MRSRKRMGSFTERRSEQRVEEIMSDAAKMDEIRRSPEYQAFEQEYVAEEVNRHFRGWRDDGLPVACRTGTYDADGHEQWIFTDHATPDQIQREIERRKFEEIRR